METTTWFNYKKLNEISYKNLKCGMNKKNQYTSKLLVSLKKYFCTKFEILFNSFMSGGKNFILYTKKIFFVPHDMKQDLICGTKCVPSDLKGLKSKKSFQRALLIHKIMTIFISYKNILLPHI